MKRLLSTGAIAFALFGLAPGGFGKDEPTYTAEEAGKHIGETATISGKIEDAHQSQGGPAFLNMGGRHPNETFTVFISAGDSAAFKDVKDYMGKTVAVTGKIKDHNGKPEIMVKAPADIVVKDEGTGSSSSASAAPSATASPKASP